jgi:hypothetical protein
MILNMKKNIVQDVIPPKKSIRNVELLYKSKRPERVEKVEKPERVVPMVRKDIETKKVAPPPPVEDFSYKYDYDEPVKRSKKVLYFSVGILVIALVFGISALFKSADIKITPKNEIVSVNEAFKAQKDTSTNGGLVYQIVTTTKDVEKTVPASEETNVEKKATGRIVIYNNYSSEPQKLIATTRFETPEGLVYRTKTDVVVPGIQTKEGKSVAGSVEVMVEADKPGPSYNIGLKDFTIAGFKGTPKYTKMYGRSKTEMTGGFSGMQKVVSEETLSAVDKELEDSLKSSLAKDIISQIPENFVLYESSVSYDLESTNQAGSPSSGSNATSSVILKKKGSVSAVIFDKGSLSRVIIAKVLPNVVDDIIKITNLSSLSFEVSPDSQFDPSTSTLLNFNIKGDAKLVWVFDENKLKTELLGISKKNAITVISMYDTIKEAKIETHPFWNQTIPQDPKEVKLVNTIAE